MGRTCETCPAELPAGCRKDRRFCNECKRERLRAFVRSESSIARRKNYYLQRSLDPDLRGRDAARARERARKRLAIPEVRAAVNERANAAAKLRYRNDPIYRAAVLRESRTRGAVRQRERLKNPEYRARYNARRAETDRKRLQDPERRAKRNERQRARLAAKKGHT